MDKTNILTIILVFIAIMTLVYVFVVVFPEMERENEQRMRASMMKPYNYTSRNIEESYGVPHGQIGFYKTIVCPATNKTEDSVIYADTIVQHDPFDQVTDNNVPRANTVSFFYCTDHHVLFSYP